MQWNGNKPGQWRELEKDISSTPFLQLIPSGSEDEAPNLNVWVSKTIYRLTHDDRELVLSHSGWLTDKIITAAQMLILQHFPKVSGLQPPTLQKVFAFHVHCGEFVQIINISNNHWCVVSTVGCDSGVINVYGSLPKRTIPDKTIHLIGSLVSCKSSTLGQWMLQGSQMGLIVVF